jgi:predicted nucleotidyltransferase component of viral defense system
MIPKPYIAEWKDHAPWESSNDVEQDLVISRALIALYSDEFLRETLVFRGGTALHKLFLDPAPRYSEDIDLVQIKPGPIKPIFEHISKAITFFEEPRSVKPGPNNNTLMYRFTSEYEGVRLRLKLEINCREHFNILPLVEVPFAIDNGWFSGKADIVTYDLNELLGTKLRALYQRKKGRDLFDLDYARRHAVLDLDKILECYSAYMDFVVDKPPTKKLFLRNLEEKQTDPDFLGDMEALLRKGVVYDPEAAFEWVRAELVERLG